MPQREEDAGPGVDQLRQEVATLRRDVDTIRSTMQDMHREVGSAVLLLSRFVGLQWNTDEVVGLVEDKTALASGAVDRLADNVGTLQQRLTIAEETKLGGTRREASTSIDEAPVPDAASTMVEQESCFTEVGAGCNSSTPRRAADESTPSISAPSSSSSSLPSLPRDMDMGGSARGRVVSAPGRREDAEDAESAAGSGDERKRTDGQLLLDAAGEGHGASLSLSRTKHIDENGQQPSASKIPPLRRSRASSVAIDDGDGTGMATAELLPKERQGGLSRDGELAAAPGNTNCSREEIESEDANANDKGVANPPVGAEEDRAETTASARQSTTSDLQRLAAAAEAADGAAVATNEENGSAGQMAEDELMRGGRRTQHNGVNEVVERNIHPAGAVKSSQRTPVQPAHVRTSSEIAVGIAGDAVSNTSRKGTLVPIRDSSGDEKEEEQGSGEDINETPTASKRGGVQTNIATPSALLGTRKRSSSSGRLLDPWVSTGETSALIGENGETTREIKGKDEEQGRMGEHDGEQRQSNLAAGANGNAETTAPIKIQGGSTLLPKEFRGLAGETTGGTTPGGRSSLLDPVQPRPTQASASIKPGSVETRSMSAVGADNAKDASETGDKSNITHNSNSAPQAGTSSVLSKEARQSQSIQSNEDGSKERSTPQVTERAAVATVEGLNNNNCSGGERDDSSQTSSGSSFTTSTTSDSRRSSFSGQQSTTTSTATSSSSRTKASRVRVDSRAANGGSSDSGRRRGRRRSSSASTRDHIEEVPVTGGGGNLGSTEVDSGLSSFTPDRRREVSDKGGEAVDGDTVSGGGGEGEEAVMTPRSKTGHRQQ